MMKKSSLSIFFVFALLLLTSGCSSSPVLYPNAKYESVGKEVAQSDIEACEQKADDFLESPKGKQILAGAGGGAAVGSAVGAVGGLFSGDFLGSLVRGAAIGGAAGATAGAISPDSLKRRFVEQCLGRLGYQVIGWD